MEEIQFDLFRRLRDIVMELLALVGFVTLFVLYVVSREHSIHLQIREVVASPPFSASATFQVPSATTYWRESLTTETFPGITTVTTTWNEIEFTQTFGQPTTCPAPLSGIIGMGTLTGEIGIVKPTVTTIAGIEQKVNKDYAVQTSAGFRRRPRPIVESLALVPWTSPATPVWKFLMMGLFTVFVLHNGWNHVLGRARAEVQAAADDEIRRVKRMCGINEDDEIKLFSCADMKAARGDLHEAFAMARMREEIDGMKNEKRHE